MAKLAVYKGIPKGRESTKYMILFRLHPTVYTTRNFCVHQKKIRERYSSMERNSTLLLQKLSYISPNNSR